MPITALPQATVHLLGSAQVLTTPVSLVKELIDNALDAKATSIDIIISKNTLDKLEVRDNGHGISSEDFDSLGKRGHTSKLQTFEELRFIGGLTLGFRGEALASAVELGDVSVATKTEGEAVATKLVLKALEGVHQKTHTSHPVGTTVSVLKFMHKLAVRKKTFEKEAPKTVTKIHQLLRSYALARPSIRFSFKIAGGAKGSWLFAPRPNENIKETVSQVIGRDASLECVEKYLVSSETHSKDPALFDVASDFGGQSATSTSGECFEIEAFLPKSDAEATKVGTGQFLSIDSRPVSHEKGTMKKIVATFKKYIRSGLAKDSEKLKNPFIRLNIKCPTASYDANVEPAKDDVLFGNELVVLDLVEVLLKEVYGDLPPVSVSQSMARRLDDFDLLLARYVPIPALPPPTMDTTFVPPGFRSSASPTPQESSVTGGSPTVEDGSINEQLGTDQRHWGFNMSRDFSEDVDDSHQVIRPNRNFMPIAQAISNHETTGSDPLNPWIIAKMTAPSRNDRATSEPNYVGEDSSVETAAQRSWDHTHRQNKFDPLNARPWQTIHSDDIRSLQPSVTRQHHVVRRRSLDDDELTLNTPLQSRRGNEFVTARNILEDALISPPPTQFRRGLRRSRGLNKPFMSPLSNNATGAAPADRLIQTTLFGNNAQPRKQSDGHHVMPQIEPNPDLAWAMDYEQRKQETTRRRRDELYIARMEAKSASSSAPPRSSPHKNRYNAAVASLEVGQVARPRADSEKVKQPFRTTLPDGDPRAYLMRRQKSLVAKKGGSADQSTASRSMSRAKSNRLPLENTPEAQRLHNLVHNLQTDKKDILGAMGKLAGTDTYVHRGRQSAGLMVSHVENPAVARKIKEIVDLWMSTEE